MITPAQRAEIRRLYYGEHWKMGTIAAQLGLHRETVRAAVEHETGGVHRGVCRPSALDPYLPLLRNTLAQYPRLRATRIHEMVRQRGYSGVVIENSPTPLVNPNNDNYACGRARFGHGGHGPRLLARHRRPLHPRPDAGESRSRRRLRRPRRRRPHPRLRQPAQRGPRPPRRRRTVSPPPARPRGPLPLRAPALHPGTRKREGSGFILRPPTSTCPSAGTSRPGC